jgi:hypothetical protein
LLQVNCRSIYNKVLEFENLLDTYNPDIIVGTDSWLREELGNTDLFKTDFTTFRRYRNAHGKGMSIYVGNNITCSQLWVNNDFKMLSFEIKYSDPKHAWKIVGIFKAPNEDIFFEKLAERTGIWDIP